MNLVDSLDPAYAEAPGARLVMTRHALTPIQNLCDHAGRPLLPVGRDSTGDCRILDYKVFISPSMDPMGSSKRPIAFGDISRLVVRRVAGSMAAKVYRDRFADVGQLAYESFPPGAGWRGARCQREPGQLP